MIPKEFMELRHDECRILFLFSKFIFCAIQSMNTKILASLLPFLTGLPIPILLFHFLQFPYFHFVFLLLQLFLKKCPSSFFFRVNDSSEFRRIGQVRTVGLSCFDQQRRIPGKFQKTPFTVIFYILIGTLPFLVPEEGHDHNEPASSILHFSF